MRDDDAPVVELPPATPSAAAPLPIVPPDDPTAPSVPLVDELDPPVLDVFSPEVPRLDPPLPDEAVAAGFFCVARTAKIVRSGEHGDHEK